jgi:hypothetical protein
LLSFIYLSANATTEYSPRDLPAAENWNGGKPRTDCLRQAFRQRKRVKGNLTSDTSEDKKLGPGMFVPDVGLSSTEDTFTPPDNNVEGRIGQFSQPTGKRKDSLRSISQILQRLTSTHSSRMAPVLTHLLTSAVVMDLPVDRIGRLFRLVGLHRQKIQKLGTEAWVIRLVSA